VANPVAVLRAQHSVCRTSMSRVSLHKLDSVLIRISLSYHWL